MQNISFFLGGGGGTFTYSATTSHFPKMVRVGRKGNRILMQNVSRSSNSDTRLVSCFKGCMSWHHLNVSITLAWQQRRARDPQISRSIMQLVMWTKNPAPPTRSVWSSPLMSGSEQPFCATTSCILLVKPRHLQMIFCTVKWFRDLSLWKLECVFFVVILILCWCRTELTMGAAAEITYICLDLIRNPSKESHICQKTCCQVWGQSWINGLHQIQ